MKFYLQTRWTRSHLDGYHLTNLYNYDNIQKCAKISAQQLSLPGKRIHTILIVLNISYLIIKKLNSKRPNFSQSVKQTNTYIFLYCTWTRLLRVTSHKLFQLTLFLTISKCFIHRFLTDLKLPQCEGNGSGLLKDSVMQRNPFLKLYTNDCSRHHELITDEKVFISTINRR